MINSQKPNYPRGSGKNIVGSSKTLDNPPAPILREIVPILGETANDFALVPALDEKAVRKTRHLEAAEQITLMDQVRLCLDKDGNALPHRPGANLIFALANENAAGRGIGILRWKMGVRPGLQDLGVFVPRNGYHGAFIELKQSGGVASDVRQSQRECQEKLNRQGYKAVVCYGWFDAWKFLCNYLGWDE